MSAEQPANTVYQNDLHESRKKIYMDTESADVRFSFGSSNNTSTQVPAHKNLLAAKSDVFKAMFYGKMKEKGNVHVPDTSEAAFMEFLPYFYFKKVELSAEHVEGVLYLGQKYNVEYCINDCIRILIKFLDNENVCSRLHLGILYVQSELIKACETHILLNTVAFFKSLGFLTCDRQMLAYILKMNQLSCSEVEVFEACMSWVKAQSKQDVLSKELVQLHLGDLFYEIRFASMKIEDFCALAQKYNSVLSSHHRIIVDMIVLPDSRNEESSKFNASPRHAKWNKKAIIKCDRKSHNQETYDLDTIEIMKFSSNLPLFLGSIMCAAIYVYDNDASNACYGNDYPADLRSDLVVDVKIYELHDVRCKSESGNLLLKMKAKLQSENTNVDLPQPILVRPGFFYSIKIGSFPQAHYCYSGDDINKEIKLESGIVIQSICNYDMDGHYSDNYNDDDDNSDDEYVELVDENLVYHDCYDNDNEQTTQGLIMGLNFNRI